ncbi:MAG: plastocyanin [Gemmatimonadaceae bacterium]|nr:plastocyanin [Gemmatimonadaceae bacterium]
MITTAVSMRGSAFDPPAIQVSPSAVVTFTNADNFAHNVTFSTGGVAASGNFSTGSRQVTMPAAPGTYGYNCTLHGGMSGTVLVK